MPNFNLRLLMVSALLVFASAGCSSQIVKDPGSVFKEMMKSKSEQELGSGIKSYEDGAYKTAAKQLQAALDMGLDSKSDQAKAHKYLAFIDCAAGREKACREDFRKAFDADPQFGLEPAESGHPVWGAVFLSVKAEVAAKSKPR